MSFSYFFLVQSLKVFVKDINHSRPKEWKDFTNHTEDNGEWSQRICTAGKMIEAGTLKLDDIHCYVGGPNGRLMFDNIETMDRVVMISGGIGITPMAAILEDLIMQKAAGTFRSEILFIWATRSPAEISAFTYLFNQCSDPSINIQIHFTGTATLEATKGPVNVHIENAESSRECSPPGCLPVEVPLDDIAATPEEAPVEEPATTSEEGTGTGSGSGVVPTAPNASVVVGRFVLDTLVPVSEAGVKTGILCCGPEAMMIDAEAFANAREAAGEEIYFHRETFDL